MVGVAVRVQQVLELDVELLCDFDVAFDEFFDRVDEYAFPSVGE